MRNFFDRLDACTACDVPIFIFVALVCVALTIWATRHNRRAKRNFFTALRLAQNTFMEHGYEDIRSQLATMEALYAWSVWQHRPPADVVGTKWPSEVEWYALSLMQSLPAEDRRQLPA